MERQTVTKVPKTPQRNHSVQRQSAAPSTAGNRFIELQRSIGNQAVQRLIKSHFIQAKLQVSAPGDPYEQEADRVAGQVMRLKMDDGALMSAPPIISRVANGSDSDFDVSPNLKAQLDNSGHGGPLPNDVRAFMEPRLGADLSHVRVHTGSNASQLNQGLSAEAFTYGSSVYFGSGRGPGKDALTAHELTHVIQQTGGGRTQSVSGPVNGQVSRKRIQRHLVSGISTPNGEFDVNFQTLQGAAASPPTFSGLDGYIRFVPTAGAPNSNTIIFIQIAKITDLAGADIPARTIPAGVAPRGALGDPGVRTQDDPARGVEGGFLTDVYHNRNPAAPAPESPRYGFQPAAPGTTGILGGTAQPAQYGGGIGGRFGQTPGFKRSDDPADIRSAAMYDRTGVASATANFDVSFETVARGEDTMINYGAVTWGYGLRNGVVVNERLAFHGGASATFGEALERHRDFYVHEPVTFYFPFDSDVLSATETAKIDTFTAYLTRNTDVRLSLEGFADIRGEPRAHAYNINLSRRRAMAVNRALIARGIPASRINSPVISSGASTAATTDAGTGDQGGSAALGADQSREANRQFNRRVVLTFQHTVSRPHDTAPAGP